MIRCWSGCTELGEYVPMNELKLIPIGTGTGVIIPDEMLARFNLKQGDALNVLESDHGSLIFADAKGPDQIEAGRRFMHENRDVFDKLAK